MTTFLKADPKTGKTFVADKTGKPAKQTGSRLVAGNDGRFSAVGGKPSKANRMVARDGRFQLEDPEPAKKKAPRKSKAKQKSEAAAALKEEQDRIEQEKAEAAKIESDPAESAETEEKKATAKNK